MSLDEVLWDRHEKYDLQEKKLYECAECKKEFEEKDCSMSIFSGKIYLNSRKQCICIKCDEGVCDDDLE